MRSLTALVSEANAAAHRALGTTSGVCGLVCRVFGRQLTAFDYRPVLTCGLYSGASHWWLTIGSILLDPTADQFGSRAHLSTACGQDARYQPLISLELPTPEYDQWIAAEIERLQRPGQRGYGQISTDAAIAYLRTALTAPSRCGTRSAVCSCT
jgi:hypothetical protein